MTIILRWYGELYPLKRHKLCGSHMAAWTLSFSIYDITNQQK